MKIRKKEETYPCDPEKNKDCGKQSCYLHGGPCRLTTNPKFQKTFLKESPKNVKKKDKGENKNESSKGI